MEGGGGYLTREREKETRRRGGDERREEHQWIHDAYKEVESAIRAIDHARTLAYDAARVEFVRLVEVVAAADDETFEGLRRHSSSDHDKSVSLVRSEQLQRRCLRVSACRLFASKVLMPFPPLRLLFSCLGTSPSLLPLPSLLLSTAETLGRHWDAEVRASLLKRHVIAGAFSFDVDCEGLAPPLGLEGMKEMARLRSKYMQLPYGDQVEQDGEEEEAHETETQGGSVTGLAGDVHLAGSLLVPGRLS
eukprot:753784-Hanusia_phi.AAC.1